MKKAREIRWLYDQLPILTEQGILKEEQVTAIRKHYGAPPPAAANNVALVVVSTLGALLVGGGIILIFAYNWYSLSRSWRTALSFAPLVLAQILYGYTFFRKPFSGQWIEGTSTFLMLMLASCIALISQTYNVSGSTSDFLWTWMILSIPLLFLMESTLVGCIYMVGIAFWAVYTADSTVIGYWALLGIYIPMIVQAFRRDPESVRSNLLGWTGILTLFFAWFWVIEWEIPGFLWLGTSLLLVNLYFLDQQLRAPNRALFRKPLYVGALVGILIFIVIITFDQYPEPFNGQALFYGLNRAPWAGVVNFVVLLGLLGLYGFLFFKDLKTRNLPDHLIAAFPVLVLLCLSLYRLELGAVAWVLANLFMLAYGVLCLMDGIQEKKMASVNWGMLVILLLIVIRFFDSDWSFLVKGITFVVLGIVFLSVNLVLARRLKGNIKEETME